MMYKPVTLSFVQDRRTTTLPPLWLRRAATSAPIPESVSTRVWQTGSQGQFRKEMLAAIDQAQELICASSFLWSDPELTAGLVRAAARRVRVYLLTASEARLAKMPSEDSEFDARMIEEHKSLLNQLAGKVLVRTADDFHAKFMLVDPPQDARATGGRGYLSTANMNKALLESVELGVALSTEANHALFGAFCEAFWLRARQELLEPNRLRSVGQPPTRPPPWTSGTAFVTNQTQQGLREEVLRLVRSSRRELWIATYGIKDDHVVTAAIEERARAGVRVRLLTRPRAAVADAVKRLTAAGVAVAAHEKLHAKAVVSDGVALVMTANLEPHGMDRGFEVGVRLSSEEARAVEQLLSQWWEAFPWRYAAAAEVGSHVGEVREPKSETISEVLKEVEIPLGSVESPSALSPDGASRPSPSPWPDEKWKWTQQIVYHYVVEPPVLPKGAKEVMQVIQRTESWPFPVFRKGKKRWAVGSDNNKSLVSFAKGIQAEVVSEPPQDAEPEPKIVKERRSYSPRLFDVNGQKYVQLEHPDQVGAAKALAREHNARIVT